MPSFLRSIALVVLDAFVVSAAAVVVLAAVAAAAVPRAFVDRLLP